MPNAKPFPLYTDGAGIFYTTDGVNFNTIASAALATPTTAGLMSAGLGPYITQSIDLTTTGTIVITPGVPGKTFFPLRFFVATTAATGAITGNATIEIGQTGALGNIIAAGTNLTNSAAFAFGAGGYVAANIAQGAFIPGADTVVTVTAGATGTGGFAYAVKVVVYGVYV